jgi:biotin synthesis protein BioG
VKHFWLISNKNKKLIIFFNGWGMDYTLFKEYKSEKYDVLSFYAYSTLEPDFDFNKLFNQYNEINLISWSMGVWVGNVIMKKFADKLNYKIAINSTLKPVDDDFGIVTKVYKATIDNFSPISKAKFFKRMWNNVEIPEMFIKHKTIRETEEQKQELIFLQKSFKEIPEPENIYKYVLIADNDLICPTKNQKNYWQDKIDFKTINGPHFIFYHWKTWEDLIEYVIKN